MSIRWSYYLIAAIYVLLIVLRGINYLNEAEYKKENANYGKVFSIKKDFFTTVALICIAVTLAINIAALIGGKSLNTSSICVTLLVIGFTILNSMSFIFYSKENQTICFLGYTLKESDIESLKVKSKKSMTKLNITFGREIESYNYAKLLVFGENKESLAKILEQMASTTNK